MSRLDLYANSGRIEPHGPLPGKYIHSAVRTRRRHLYPVPLRFQNRSHQIAQGMPMEVALHVFPYLPQGVFLNVDRRLIFDRFNVFRRDLSREAHGDRTTAFRQGSQPLLRVSGPGAEHRTRRPQGSLEVVIKLITTHFRVDPFDSTTLDENAGIRSVEVVPGENPYGKEIRPLPGHNRKVTRLDEFHEEPDLAGVTADHVQGTIRREKPQSLSELIPARYAGDVFPETEPDAQEAVVQSLWLPLTPASTPNNPSRHDNLYFQEIKNIRIPNSTNTITASLKLRSPSRSGPGPGGSPSTWRST